MLRALGFSLVALVALLLGGAPAAAESIFDDAGSQEVEQATDRLSVKTDLVLCAPHLARLRDHADAAAMHEAVEDPECRKAILNARAAGLSKAEIVSTLMGASDIPDPNGFTTDHAGPPVVID